MSPVAGRTYAYQTAPWDAPLSLGVQAFIEYNGVILNDRRQSDRIRVTSITGLDDADISDSREAVPGDDGEFVYDSWQRGRTFVMSGQIQAGSLGTLESMQRDLKAAFGTLVEAPMKFRWFDVYDSFDEYDTLDNYSLLSGSSSGLVVDGSVLQWRTTSAALITRTADNRLWADAQTTIRVVVGNTAGTSAVYVLPSILDAYNYVCIELDTSSGVMTLKVSAVVYGTKHTLGSTTVTGVVQGQSVWLRAKKEGDLMTGELWTTEPADSTLPQFSVAEWLTGSDADLLGDQVLTLVGFGAQTAAPDWAMDDFFVQSICPGDIAFNAKKLSPLSIKDSQDSKSQYVRTFQITMRSSQPYGRGATQSRSLTLVPSPSSTTELGFSSLLTSPLRETTFIPGTIALQNNILSVRNAGTAPERPLIVVFGAIRNFSITSLTNGMQLIWSGGLPDGDYLAFDCQRKTLVNSNGQNMKAFLSYSDPRWMTLLGGWNDLYIAGTDFSASTKMICFFHGRWN